jgi:aerobic-type carbon monoxide dehydrogenase small subunit (CoxS/CutS family)
MKRILELNVNGTAHRVEADSEKSLLNVLRDDLDLTGAKYGCGEGQCGACTVLAGKDPIRSCVTKIGAVAGKQIKTIEGLENNGRLHPLQQAFLEEDAFQCGYCTSGMIMSGVALLSKAPDSGEEEIARFMEKNVCRCGTHPRIIAAIVKAGRAMKGGAK